MRFGVELTDISGRAADSDFQIFKDAVANGGNVSCISAPAKGSFSRKIIDELTEFVKIYGLKGLSWSKVENGGLTGGVSKHFPENKQSALIKDVGAEDGDVIFFAFTRSGSDSRYSRYSV